MLDPIERENIGRAIFRIAMAVFICWGLAAIAIQCSGPPAGRTALEGRKQ